MRNHHVVDHQMDQWEEADHGEGMDHIVFRGRLVVSGKGCTFSTLEPVGILLMITTSCSKMVNHREMEKGGVDQGF